ncbi:MAG: ATP-dependent DNA ligase [Taibaiella sp.]|nr:ATP-dependent DNA ligase [Taibaiella sp.]
MKRFTLLIQQLELSNKTNDKIAALVNYFTHAEDKDKVWVLAFFTGKKPKRPIKAALLKYWVMEITGLPEWLFTECHHNVGDLSETIALLLPLENETSDRPLYEWIEELQTMEGKDDATKKAFVMNAWRTLDTQERFIFNKLISGNFRIGVSDKLLVNALARLSGNEPSRIMHSIMGKWDPYLVAFAELTEGTNVNTDNSWPYPFCLAYALENQPATLGETNQWQAEWKWDGIRGQVIKRNGELFIWSRGEELVTPQFPELQVFMQYLPDGTVIDGEILAVKDKHVLPFSTLQQRLNRKVISKKQLEDAPVGFYIYDLLEYKGADIRERPMKERRLLLEQLVAEHIKTESIQLSPTVKFDTWEELATIREGARELNSEGIMLKKLDSHYHSGRKRGDWWKWKINPYTVDAVMIYAQKGSGRRAGHYTDYTFAVRDGEMLVTIAKAYSGLTDEEIKEVSSFVNKNSIEKFGPVRTVKPELVFEIAFEGIAESKRHKAGIALRFPRIARWRKDKVAAEINTLEDLRQLLQSTL